ncbi:MULTISPECIES: guanine deaminase [Clostridium]|uniref:Guanine deaminase n=1 Tax=Clostridium frigoriphilum TaxID=443253 RepID=A0ABU7USF3_9CLOT|nr:guanine deaminase [Clostridium sp. DSM 17811]MBU3101212.1 guanine deaminase [Clostridium sp. DSM 17811]
MRIDYAVKGNIIFTKVFGEYEVIRNGYIVVQGNLVKGVYKKLNEEFSDLKVIDYGNAMIIPGFVDIHLHASQFANLGLGLDKELMPWLEEYTFPEEAKYVDISYAKKVYSSLIRELWKFGTTRSCVFATIHKKSTKLLMDMFARAGLSAYVGKVNMDRNSPQDLTETAVESIRDTEEILKEYTNKYELVKPIVTPRFVPSCSFDLLKNLGILAKKYNAPIQSHLSENYGEISFVKELHPNCKNYTSVYNEVGLLGDVPTIMAHCVLVDADEIELLARKKVFIAHCPSSNCNLASGNAPIRKLLEKGVKVGLASDISAGNSLSMMDIIVSAAQVSNIKWIESGRVDKPLNIAELFYLATKGGGEFFGKVGSFEEGYAFDALVIDDSSMPTFKAFSIEERLQRFIYAGDDRNIKVRYVAGREIEEPECFF